MLYLLTQSMGKARARVGNVTRAAGRDCGQASPLNGRSSRPNLPWSMRHQWGVTAGAPALVRQRRSSAYEADGDRHRDLVQRIHSAIRRSVASFNRRCGPQTWAYRAATPSLRLVCRREVGLLDDWSRSRPWGRSHDASTARKRRLALKPSDQMW